jgi:hypothetical protein
MLVLPSPSGAVGLIVPTLGIQEVEATEQALSAV